MRTSMRERPRRQGPAHPPGPEGVKEERRAVRRWPAGIFPRASSRKNPRGPYGGVLFVVSLTPSGGGYNEGPCGRPEQRLQVRLRRAPPLSEEMGARGRSPRIEDSAAPRSGCVLEGSEITERGRDAHLRSADDASVGGARGSPIRPPRATSMPPPRRGAGRSPAPPPRAGARREPRAAGRPRAA